MKNPFVITYLMILIMFLGKETQAQTFDSGSQNQEYFNTQKRNAIKLNVLPFLVKHFELSYQRALTDRTSLQFTLGMTNPFGKNKKIYERSTLVENYREASSSFGWSANLGYRIYLFNLNRPQNPNILKGLYLEPNLLAGKYFTTQYVSSIGLNQDAAFIKTKKTNYQAAMINLGYQAVFFKQWTLEMYLGFGLANDNLPKNDGTGWVYFGELHQGLYKPDGGTTGAFKTGLRIGYAF